MLLELWRLDKWDGKNGDTIFEMDEPREKMRVLFGAS